MTDSPLETDIAGLLPSGFIETLGTDAVREVVGLVAEGARAEWLRLAEGLTRTRGDYTKGIQEVTYREGQDEYLATIMLVGNFANALERGQDAYDMHDTLLGPNVPVVKARAGLKGKHEKADGSGYYRVIPFRPQTPKSDGLFGSPMGQPYVATLGVKEAEALGERIYAMAKKLTPTKGMPGEKIRWGQSIPAGMAGPKLREHHAAPIYAGMYRQAKTYETATQGAYVTFRTISTGSPGWRRKKTEGLHFAEKVKGFTEGTLLPQIFTSLMQERG